MNVAFLNPGSGRLGQRRAGPATPHQQGVRREVYVDRVRVFERRGRPSYGQAFDLVDQHHGVGDHPSGMSPKTSDLIVTGTVFEG